MADTKRFNVPGVAAFVRLTAFALLGILLSASTASAQLDPLLFLKRTPPTIIVVFDNSVRMLEDGNGNFYDPHFYVTSDDAAVMASFPHSARWLRSAEHTQRPPRRPSGRSAPRRLCG